MPGQPDPSPPTPPLRFGLDAGSLEQQNRLGLAPDYEVLWVGAWTLHHGWGDTDKQLDQLRSQNRTPAIQFYYWGDDMAPGCLVSGCAGKTTAGWARLGDELGAHLTTHLHGAPALVLLESEFNKGNVATLEPLDALMAERAAALHAAYPAAQVVLSFGNWNPTAWSTWDRAAAAADMTGLQAITAATRDPDAKALALPGATLEGAKTLQALFGKPVVVQDLAVSSYGPTGATTQEKVLGDFASCLGALRQAGVVAVLYRGLADSTTMDTKNYFGEAERHFGLLRDGEKKAGGTAWIQAMNGQTPEGLCPA